MEKTMRIGTVKTWSGGRYASVYIRATYQDGKFSMSGVVGPLHSGNALGGCGQIDMEFEHRNSDHNDSRYNDLITPQQINFAPGWTAKKWFDLLEIWAVWHLNDMQAGCEHQRAEKWEKVRIDPAELPNSHANRDGKGILASWVYPKEHPKGLLTKPCPVCGYRYGTAWLKKDVPQSVIDFVENLPNADKTPAWI